MTTAEDQWMTEEERVWRWRYREARKLGLSKPAARAFAESDGDLERARQLQRAGCPPELLERIVL
jgi:hypothetical protein